MSRHTHLNGRTRPACNVEENHSCANHDERVGQAVAEFVKATDQGNSVDVDGLLAKYGDVAKELAACIETFEFMQKVAPQLTDLHSGNQQDDSPSSAQLLATLGDFRIVREIGRGGM